MDIANFIIVHDEQIILEAKEQNYFEALGDYKFILVGKGSQQNVCQQEDLE